MLTIESLKNFGTQKLGSYFNNFSYYENKGEYMLRIFCMTQKVKWQKFFFLS